MSQFSTAFLTSRFSSALYRNDPVELDKILGSASVENSSNEITSTDAITQLSRELWIASTKKRNNDAPLDK